MNISHNSQKRYLDDSNSDGTKVFKSPRSNPKQSPVCALAGGQVVTYQQTLTPALIATLTAAEQALTVGTTAGNGPATTDFLAAINKPTAQAGIGFQKGRISAANTLQFTFSNTTGGNLTPTAGEVYNVTVLRGVVTNTQSITPAVCAATTTNEQIFAITNTQPVITLTVDGKGSLLTATLVTGGTGFYKCPTLLVEDVQGGSGAVLRCDVSALGVITQVYIDDAGAGYVAPTVTAIGGNTIEKGMVAMITKPTQTAGLAISNVRVSGNNEIAVQFANPTAAAITPTAENYVICCLNDIPATSNLTSYGVVATGLASIAANTSAEQTLTVNGLVATDISVGVSKPTLNAGSGVCNHRVSAANTLAVSLINATAAFITPSATEIWGVTVYNQNPVVPFKKFAPILSPVSIAANTSAEQTFTVTGLPFTISPSTVVVNKQSHQPGLVMGGARVTAANTLGITFENITAAAITPTANEQYIVGCFQGIPPVSGVPGGWIALPFNQSLQHTVEQVGEVQDALVQEGIIKGA